MRYVEQSDFVKALLAAAGVASASDVDVVNGTLIVDGVPCDFIATPRRPAEAVAVDPPPPPRRRKTETRPPPP